MFNKIKQHIHDSDKLVIELACEYLSNNKSNIDIYNELKFIYNNPALINDVITIINCVKKYNIIPDKYAEYIKLLKN